MRRQLIGLNPGTQGLVISPPDYHRPQTTILPRLPSSPDHHRPQTTVLPRLPSSPDYRRPQTTVLPRLPSSPDYHRPQTTIVPRPPLSPDHLCPQTTIVPRLPSSPDYRRPQIAIVPNLGTVKPTRPANYLPRENIENSTSGSFSRTFQRLILRQLVLENVNNPDNFSRIIPENTCTCV